MSRSLPGAIKGCDEDTLRLMLTALISVCPSSPFFTPSEQAAFMLIFPVTELEALWLGVLMSGVG